MDFSRCIWPQTTRGSLGSLAPLGSLPPLGSPGSSGSYVYAHMRFLDPHLPGLLPILCDGKHRPVRRWPLFGRNRPFASWGGTLKRVKISRFQIDASLTDSFALPRPSSCGDSYTSPVVVVGRLASTWCQRPNDTSLGASGRKPRWARRARTCIHTCVFFPLICLACFPSSATASTDRFGDGHFSAEIDLWQAGGVR